MKKLLLLGSAGMAGQILKCELLKLTDKIELVDVARSNKISIPRIKLDIKDFNQLGKIVRNGNFDYVLNCIGLLKKQAEENPDEAILINSYLPHYLEKTTSDLKTRVIHLSTDCVFSGKSGGYIESDTKDGLGFYAQSKALGEIINSKDLTIRTSIIGPDLNENGIGLFKWLLNQTGVINGYTRVFWSGITTVQLARFIIEIVFSSSTPSGLIHLTNNAKISKFELLNVIINVFRLTEVKIVEFDNYLVDKSLLNTRGDLKLNVPSYIDMVSEMREWMVENKY